MSDEVEEVSSEQSDSTPAIEESAPQAESGGADEQKASPEQKSEDKLPPFHEHPRFKEVIEQNRGYKTELESYKEALNRLQGEMQSFRQQSLPKKEEPQDKFLADLEKVNPEYAKSLKQVYDRAAKAEAVEQRLQQYEQQQFASKAVNHLSTLMETNKVADPVDRKVYERAIRSEVYEREARGEKLGIKDLDTIFSSFHQEYSKAMEDRLRKATAQYVQQKKSDATPSGATGGGALSSTVKKMKTDEEIVKWMAQELRRSKQPI